MVTSRRAKICAPLALSTAVSLVLAALAPSSGAGQPAPGAETQVEGALAGRWELAIDPAAARQRIEGAIGAVTRVMLPVISGIADGRLRERNSLSRGITIVFRDDRIRVEFDDAVFDTPAGHEIAMPLPGHESETVRVHQSIRNGALSQVFSTEEGRRWNTLTPSADGRGLSFDVVLRSSQLPSDVRYTLPYRAAGR